MTAPLTPSILIVDADEIYARTIADKLKGHGLQASTVSDSQQAMSMILQDPFQVVLSDVWMPGKNGFELAQEVREEKIARPEIILMSSDPKVSLFEAHQAGACYLLRKPLNFDELSLALKRFGDVSTGAEPQIDPMAALGRLYGQIRVAKQKKEFPVEISNLGRGGFFFKTNSKFPAPPVGQIIDFDLKLGMVPDCHCIGRGIIRWNYQTMLGDTGVGVEFLKVPDWFHQVVHSFADLFKVKSFIPLS
ncbi:MAG: response regulator [Bdellovibrionales bacterium]|nr:response regulator [Bdellovibrionales bacterium]